MLPQKAIGIEKNVANVETTKTRYIEVGFRHEVDH